MERPSNGGRRAVGLLVALLGLAAFACCISAESKRAEEEDLKLDGNLCSLPGTQSFELGIAAILCVSIAQIAGTFASRGLSCSREKKKWMPIVSITLVTISWVSFGLVMILLGTASIMNKGQSYGRGWLDGKCYVVKPGIYVGAAFLDLVTVLCTLGLMFTARRTVPSTLPDKSTDKNLAKKLYGALEA